MLALHGVTTTYDAFSLGPIDLTVDDEVLAVLGPSGSGKTTLLSLVAGHERVESGEIRLDGERIDGRRPENRGTGVVFQDGALFPHLTARENIAYAATEDVTVTHLAERFEIGDVLDRKPNFLSGGERQRVALARTLAAGPDAVLLDEPLSSLDVPTRRRLRDELHGAFDALDVPVVYVTHDQRTAAALGDRIAVLRDGSVEQVGTPEDVLQRPANRFVARFTGTTNRIDATVADRRDDAAVLRVGEQTLHATGDVPTGTTVTACVHPARVELAPRDEATPETDDRVENCLDGTVTRWLNEGAMYRATVDINDAPVTLDAAVRPATFERTESAVRAHLPLAAIHLLDGSDA